MTTAVFYDNNAIFISTYREPIVAGTLVATATGNVINVTNIHSSANIVSGEFSDIVDINGNGFANVSDCLTYLNAQFGMRRSLDIPTASGVAAVDIPQGTPVAVSRQTQQLVPARADTYALSFVAGLAAADIASGFVGNATRVPITLTDWTAIAGSQSLATGQPYFLGPTGGMTLSAPSRASAVCLVCLGQATGPQTFLFQQSEPLTL